MNQLNEKRMSELRSRMWEQKQPELAIIINELMSAQQRVGSYEFVLAVRIPDDDDEDSIMLASHSSGPFRRALLLKLLALESGEE